MKSSTTVRTIAAFAVAVGLTATIAVPAQAKGGATGGYGTIVGFSDFPSSPVLAGSVVFGRMNDSLFVGDWDGDGRDSLAARRGNTYYLQPETTAAYTDRAVSYGKTTDETYVGDWDGDGVATLAVRRGSTFHFTDRWEAGKADFSIAFGRAGDRIFVGDWDGDGRDSLAILRDGLFHVTNDLSTARTARVVDVEARFPTALITVGDWDGDGEDTLGFRFPYAPPRQQGHSDWALYNDLEMTQPATGTDRYGLQFRYGPGTGAAFAGDWDGDGKDTLGGRGGGSF